MTMPMTAKMTMLTTAPASDCACQETGAATSAARSVGAARRKAAHTKGLSRCVFIRFDGWSVGGCRAIGWRRIAVHSPVLQSKIGVAQRNDERFHPRQTARGGLTF